MPHPTPHTQSHDVQLKGFAESGLPDRIAPHYIQSRNAVYWSGSDRTVEPLREAYCDMAAATVSTDGVTLFAPEHDPADRLADEAQRTRLARRDNLRDRQQAAQAHLDEVRQRESGDAQEPERPSAHFTTLVTVMGLTVPFTAALYSALPGVGLQFGIVTLAVAFTGAVAISTAMVGLLLSDPLLDLVDDPRTHHHMQFAGAVPGLAVLLLWSGGAIATFGSALGALSTVTLGLGLGIVAALTGLWAVLAAQRLRRARDEWRPRHSQWAAAEQRRHAAEHALARVSAELDTCERDIASHIAMVERRSLTLRRAEEHRDAARKAAFAGHEHGRAERWGELHGAPILHRSRAEQHTAYHAAQR